MNKFYNPKKKSRKKEIKSVYKNYTTKIFFITAICYILQMLIPAFTGLFYLHSEHILTRPWMFITAIFMHSGFYHILFNMLGLIIFGPLLEQKLGSKKFLFLYMIGGIFANIVSVIVYPIIKNGPFAALGASGAIMAMLGTLIILMPNLQVLIYGIIPMRLWTAGILWFILDLWNTFDPNSNIGGLAHIAGMFFGLAYGLFLKKQYGEAIKKTNNKDPLSKYESDDIISKYV